MSRILALMRVLVRVQVAPPMRSRAGLDSPPPRKRVTRSMRVRGT